jgi:hypothetical protein
MVRLAGIIVCISGIFSWALPASAVGQEDMRLDDEVRCSSVQSGKPIKFEGRTLIETPDLPPELRQVNAFISVNCLKRAQQLQEAFVAAHPEDYTVTFLNARLSWGFGSQPRAKAIGNAVLHQHPDFSSMLVLMASLAVDEKDYERAQKMLDRVDQLQPDDLWAYIDRLRLEADLIPTPATFKRMRAILDNTEFPLIARQTLYGDLRYMQGTTDADRDELFAAMMAKPDTAKDCVLARQAMEVIEFRHDPQTGARLIEDNVRRSSPCVATPLVRTLLAEAYLLEAAKIAPAPTEQNATLVREAKDAMGGNLTALAHRAALSPGLLDPIAPFLHRAVDSQGDGSDEQTTIICEAVEAVNPVMVKEELENGANPNGKCDHAPSLVKHILMTVTTEKVAQRQSILRSLLEHGARVDGLDYCASHGNGDCSQTLLPILREFDQRRASTRTTL